MTASLLILSIALLTDDPPPATDADSRTVRVAGIVLRWVPKERERNYRRLEGLVREAARRGAQVVCTTESFLDGYSIRDKAMPLAEYQALAEPIPGGDYFERLARLADELDIHFIAGLLEREGDRTYNAAVLLGPDGRLLGKYRKTALGHELARNTPGDSFPAFDTSIGRVGIMICQDRREPKTLEGLKASGAEIVFCPSGGMFGPKSNDPIVQARSRESGLGIVFVHPVEFLVTEPDGAIRARYLPGDNLDEPDPNAEPVADQCIRFVELTIPSKGNEQTAPPSIWERTILPQPFDKEPFHAVRVPEWVQDTVGVGYTLSVQSTEQRRRARAAGVTISEMGFVDPHYVYYPSRYLKKQSPHVPPDRLEREVAEYQRLGLRILAVYPPTLQGEVYERHPDWRRIGENTTVIPSVDLAKYPHGGMLCLLGPYGDFMIDVLCEIAEKFPVDAFSFDGLHYAGVCYCQHCRAAFRADTGQEIPNVNLDDPAFRRYQHWADRRLEAMVRRMQERLKGIRPDLALVTWSTNAGRFGHLRDIPRNMPARLNLLFDAPDQEFWMDETNRGATILPAFSNAYIWSLTNHRVAFSEPYLMAHGNPYGKDSFPAHEIQRRMFVALAHGASPSLAVIQPEPMQAGALQALEEVQRRHAWLTHKRPEPWGALLMSDNTRVFYGRSPGKVEERYLANVLGTFRAAVEEHLPVTLLCDWNLTPEDLAPYKVLILPNAACLDERQLAAVRDFVAKGGGLVASMDTSLYDEFGDPRDDLALRDLFGVSRRAPPISTATGKPELDENFARNLADDYWEKQKESFDLELATGGIFDEPRSREYVGHLPVLFKGRAVPVKPLDPASTPATGPIAATMAPRGVPERTAVPAALTRSFGQGRVVYFPAALDAAYYLYPLPYQRLLLARAIRWAAASPPPIEVDAPMCVHANLFRQKKAGAERLLVHLFNDVNTTAFHALPNDDVPLREETIPIHDIKVRLRGCEVSKAHLEPEGIELLGVPTGDGALEFPIPKLAVHSILVVELP